MAVVPLRLHEAPPETVRGGVAAVGNFDGVHRGHAAIMAAARELAGRDRSVVAVTFDPHPLVLLSPERYQPPLTTIAERCRLLHEVGANHVVVLQTTADMLSLTPEAFFQTVLRGSLGVRGVVEGFNFRFGRDRAGSNATLRELCTSAVIDFLEVPAFTLGDRPVSSSRVREALARGDVATATELLGRPYRVSGTVGTGARRGRTIGFPTANLEQVETLLPADGVYAVGATVAAGWFAGAAHIGPNVTFGEVRRQLEVHLLDFNDDLYGQTLAVDFVGRVRETKNFASVDALIEQMRQDVAEARRMAGLAPSPPASGRRGVRPTNRPTDLRSRVEEAIRIHVAPVLELDGAAIEVLDVDRGCARVRLNGACAGCPATVMFVVRGMEEELRRLVPEVEYLEAVP
jgi:riboflavin kinase/FMN adenylyltransferase